MEEPKANIIQADTDEEQSSNKVYSSLQRDYRPEKKQLTPEEKGLRQVHTKKKEKDSLWKSFKKSLFGGDIKNVPKYVLCNVIAPALQKMFADAVNGALGMTLFDAGQNRFNRTHTSMRSNNPTRINRQNVNRGRRSMSIENRLEQLTFDSEDELKDALNAMLDALDTYHVLSVEDVLYIGGQIETYNTDKNWGWTSLRDVDWYQLDDDSWFLNMPPVRDISNIR